MSLPPQQPGPYGGQPPDWGQPGPGQQPGGYPMQGGYPPSGGFPQPGAYPQPGAPQGGYQPYGQYGQQPQYGQPGYYGQPGGPPRKSPLPWILGGGGVAVIAIVVVLILVLSGGSDTSSPQGMSEEIARVVNERDVEGGKKLYCEQEDANKRGEPIANLDKIGPGYKISATPGSTEESGDTATAEVNLTASKDGKSESAIIAAELRKKDGAWCVITADLRESRGGTGRTGNG
jgi:hypothetical protein